MSRTPLILLNLLAVRYRGDQHLNFNGRSEAAEKKRNSQSQCCKTSSLAHVDFTSFARRLILLLPIHFLAGQKTRTF